MKSYFQEGKKKPYRLEKKKMLPDFFYARKCEELDLGKRYMTFPCTVLTVFQSLKLSKN